MRAAQGNAIFVGVLGMGLAGAWIGASGEPAVPPSIVGLLALAALSPAAAFWARRERPPWATGLLLLAVSAVAAQVVFREGVPRAHDLQSHGWALYATWRAVLDGDLWPRWTPYIGLGVPLLQFYGPLPWITTWPAMALGASPMQALQGGLITSQLLGAVGTYLAARGLGASRPAALVAAVALALAPYRLLDQSFRMAYAEAFAMGLTPWTLAQAVRVARGEPRVGPLAAGTGALVLSHPVTGLLLLPLAAPLLAGPLLRRPRAALALLLAGGLALSGTAAFWLPMVVEQSETTLSRTAPVGKQLAPLAAYPRELVRRQAWTKYDLRRKHEDEAGRTHAVPLYFGCVLLALLALAGAAPRDEDTPDPRPWAVAALLAIALSTRPTAGLLDLVPLYGRLQFPWRFLAPATACAALAGGLALDRWVAARARPWLAALVVAALAIDAAPYLGAAEWYPSYEGVVVRGPHNRLDPLDVPNGELVRVHNLRLPPASFDVRVARTQGIFPEYGNAEVRDRYLTRRPREGRLEAIGVSHRIQRRRAGPVEARPLVRLDGQFVEQAAVDLRAERVDVALPEGGAAGRLVVASQHFPGWRVRVDGGAWGDAGARWGLLAIDVPAGARRVEFRYSAWRPWDRAAGKAITGLTLLLLPWFRRQRG